MDANNPIAPTGEAFRGDVFRGPMRRLGLRQLVAAYKTPLQNVQVERLIGTLRRECLDHVIVMGQERARQIPAEFATDPNEAWRHTALDGEVPAHREA